MKCAKLHSRALALSRSRRSVRQWQGRLRIARNIAPCADALPCTGVAKGSPDDQFDNNVDPL